jgi:glycosyltransferase involved in cell wall biosynthesis
MCMFPQRLQGAAPDASPLKSVYTWASIRLSRLILHPLHKTPIDTYQIITANSAYTQSFVQSMWHRDSSILYPICEDMRIGTIKKEKIILHVGRFFADNGESHYKNHDKLLETFAGMTDLHKQGWELHFAGSVAEDVDALKYLLRLLKSAEGLPVFFHFNCPFKELRELFNRASIYWHATGYGSDPALHPEKQEHFGITTVEAMSAGDIPIVINSAGQKESVHDSDNGYLWDTLGQLAKDTRLVVSLSAKDYTALSNRTAKSAKRYDAKAFQRNVADIFAPIVND